MTNLFARFKKLDNRGMALVSVILIFGVLLTIGISLVGLTVSQHALATDRTYTTNSLMVAEAGVEQSMQELNEDDDFAGFETEQEFFNNAEQGRGTYTATVADAEDTNMKIITGVGRVYKYNESSNPISERKVRVTVVGTTSEGYSVHTGPGGLILGGSANITNSDVFVNGTITMTGAARIGTASQPLDVNVAHKSCPTGNNPGPTYPTVCGSGQSISLQQSTFIYGNVCATNQTSTGPNPSKNIQGGTGGQGLIAGCVAPPVTTPTYDRLTHISSMTTSGSATSNTYVCNSWPFDRTWPANLQLTGNVTIGGSCNVVITGNVYITGNLTINGAARVTIAHSVGTNRPEIVADGNITLGGSAQIIANNQGTGAHFMSFRSNAACNPNCSDITGTALKTTQSLETVNIGGAVNLPGMIFQSFWGKITITGSGNVGAAAGQTVDMSGAGTITFGTTLSSGERSWTISSYQYDFD